MSTDVAPQLAPLPGPGAAPLALDRPQAFRTAVAQHLADCGVTVDGPYLPTHPFLVPAPLYDELHHAARRVLDLLREAVERSGADWTARIEALGADPTDYPLFGDDRLDAETAALMARPDAVLTPDGAKFLEFNVSGTFGGTTESHLFRSLWARLLDLDAAGIRAHDPYAARCAALADVARAWNLPASVALVGSRRDVPGAVTDRYFELEVDYLRACGFEATFTEPEDLAAVLGASAEPRFAMGLRSFNTRDWADAGIDVGPVRAALDRGWPLVPGQSAGLLANKRALAWLSAEPPWMDPDDVRLIRQWLPWTRELRAGRVVRAGSEVSLLDLVHARREDFVLKRCIGMMGREVTLGRETSAAVWERAVRRAVLADDSVVQEFVDPAPLPMTLLDRAGHLHDVSVRPVVSPCLYGRHPGGCWARFFPSGEAGIVSVYGFGALENIVMAADREVDRP